MKNIAENSEVFEAYARIDFCYYMINELAKQEKKLSPLEQAIDVASGYSAFKTKEKAETAIFYLEMIIEAKKIVEADYSGDEKGLSELKKLIASNTK